MKGVIYNAFFDHVEKDYGLETLDNMISSCELDTGGAYASVGTYPVTELVQLLTRLHEFSGKPISELLFDFGFYLFDFLVNYYPEMTKHAESAFDLMGSVDQQIHTEVYKLYPDAELPRFEQLEAEANEMKLVYRSSRNLGDLALGLLHGCVSFYKEDISISMLPQEDGSVLFHMKRKS